MSKPENYNTRSYLQKTALAMLVLFTLSIALIVAPTKTFATQSADEQNAHIAQLSTLQYMIRPWEDEWLVRISVEIEEFEHLPATIEIAVPEGVFVYLFHEVGGVEFPNPSPIRSENGLDIYAGILTTGRIAYLEYILDENPVGPEPSMNVSYTPLHNVGELHLISAFPVDAAVVDTRFEYMGSGPEGEPAFGYIIENASGGQEYSISIPYQANVGLSASNPVVVAALVIAMVVFAVGVFWVFGRKKPSEDE